MTYSEWRRVPPDLPDDDIAADWIAREGDTSAVMPTPTTLRIGVNRDGTSFADCKIRRVFLTPRKMSLVETQRLSRIVI